MRLDRLFPKHRVSWILWISVLIIVFPLYYVCWPYHDLDKQYEEDRWVDCSWGEHYCKSIDRDWGRGLKIDMRAPAYVADFTEMPLRVAVTNEFTETQDAVVGVKVSIVTTATGEITETQHGQVLLRLVEGGHESMVAEEYDVPGYFQNSVAFRDIPRQGEMVATFMMRVSGGSDGEEYSAMVLLNGVPITQLARTSTFNRQKVFDMWLSKHLLFPPGANIFIPIATLFLVGFGEEVYERSVKRQGKIICLIFVAILPFLVFLVFLVLGRLRCIQCIQWDKALISKALIYIVVICISAAVGCCLGHLGRPPQGKKKNEKQGDSANQSPGGEIAGGETGEETHQLIKDETQENQADSQGTGANQQSAETPPSSAPSVPDES